MSAPTRVFPAGQISSMFADPLDPSLFAFKPPVLDAKVDPAPYTPPAQSIATPPQTTQPAPYTPAPLQIGSNASASKTTPLPPSAPVTSLSTVLVNGPSAQPPSAPPTTSVVYAPATTVQAPQSAVVSLPGSLMPAQPGTPPVPPQVQSQVQFPQVQTQSPQQPVQPMQQVLLPRMPQQPQPQQPYRPTFLPSPWDTRRGYLPGRAGSLGNPIVDPRNPGRVWNPVGIWPFNDPRRIPVNVPAMTSPYDHFNYAPNRPAEPIMRGQCQVGETPAIVGPAGQVSVPSTESSGVGLGVFAAFALAVTGLLVATVSIDGGKAVRKPQNLPGFTK